jgi:hemolysin activation/secretion protein
VSSHISLRLIAAFSGVAACIGSVTPANAQADPAQSVLQQIEQRAGEADRAASPDQQGAPVIADAAPRAELPPPGGPTVLLKQVRFQPASAFLSEAELNAIAERYIGKRVDFSQIANLVRDVNDIYAERGIVTASAILPQQELGDGVLTVQLVEGQMGAVGLLGDRRTKDDFILDRVRLTRGVNVVDVPAAAEDILRFNATHRAQLRMLLQPGASFGLTDIVLGVTEPPPQLLQFTVDNMGVESTGEFQANAIFRQYGALGIDDSLMLSGAVSQGSVAGTISYDLPIGRYGTRLSLGHTQSMINVIGGPSAGLDVTGASQATTATITNPLYVDENWTAQGVVTASYGLSSSAIADVPIVDSETSKIAAGVTVAYSGDWGMISVQPQLLYAGAHERVTDEWRNIFLFVGSASAYFRLNDDFSVVARGNWQVTDADLLPGDLLFQIGGPSTVRGYPSSGVAGDDGYFGQVEVHWASPTVESLDLFGFVDFGQVFSTFPASQTLVSSGVGVSYAPSERVNLEATVAVPILDTMPGQDVAVYGRMTSTIR